MNTTNQLAKLQAKIKALQNQTSWSQWLIQTYQNFLNTTPDVPANQEKRFWAQQSLELEEKRLEAFQAKTITTNQKIAQLLS